MSVNRYDASTGELTSIASGQRTWVGTKAAYEAAKQAGTLPRNCIIIITDDETEMDTVPTEGSPVAVTSDGIYNATKTLNDKITYLSQKSETSYINVDPYGNGSEADRLEGIKAFVTIMRQRYPYTHTYGVSTQIRYSGGYYSVVFFNHGANDECCVIEFDLHRDQNIRVFRGPAGSSSMILLAKYSHD